LLKRPRAAIDRVLSGAASIADAWVKGFVFCESKELPANAAGLICRKSLPELPD